MVKRNVTIDYRSEFSVNTTEIGDDLGTPVNNANLSRWITDRLTDDPKFFQNNLEIIKVKIESPGRPKELFEANKTGQPDKTTTPGATLASLGSTTQAGDTSAKPATPVSTPAKSPLTLPAKEPTPTPAKGVSPASTPTPKLATPVTAKP